MHSYSRFCRIDFEVLFSFITNGWYFPRQESQTLTYIKTTEEQREIPFHLLKQKQKN